MSILNITLKSLKYHRKQVIYQVLIIVILCAVITGSLMTGESVRNSLKRTSSQKLGKTNIFISSGARYFNRSLTDKFRKSTGVACTGLLEIRGTCQGLVSQVISNNTSIYAIEKDFFPFHAIDSVHVNPGEIIINRKLASSIQVKEGDDVIIRFKSISDIPSDAPFAPSDEENTSILLKIGKIADTEMAGDFSLSISQLSTPNVFIDLSDLEKYTSKKLKINRILIAGKKLSPADVTSALAKVTDIPDVGLKIRGIKATPGYEIISDRVFLDETLIGAIKEKIPSAEPFITYLANKIEKGGKVNPYSFVAAIPPGLYPEAPREGIILNNWLSDDIDAHTGDSVLMSWYAPDSLNQLIEKKKKFMVEKVLDMSGFLRDSLMMPDFPGIARSESCSAWDAGIPIKTNIIRDKDEDYWDRYRGTPKAFLNYETGRELWGSNYGPATAIRFPAEVRSEEIKQKLSGSLDPAILGFTVNDIYNESISAAEKSVDFGTLFLSLGFFLILASFVLLSFAVSYYFEIKQDEVRILYSLGFRNRVVRNMLTAETSAIAFIGCIAGSLTGYLINIILIKALNSVWTGAVQTDTLVSIFDINSILTGFICTFLLAVIFMYFKSRNYLKKLHRKEVLKISRVSLKWNGMLLLISVLFTVSLFILSLFSSERITLSFISGSLLLATLIILWRWLTVRGRKKMNLSALYYSHNPSHSVTPVLFIAAGIFAVFITALNRKNFDASINNNSSGTGGYLLWMHTSLPVREDLNSASGKRNFGLDADSVSGLSFVEMKELPGNDASCLNLNHITAPPLLGVDAERFTKQKAFSFSKLMRDGNIKEPWRWLERDAGSNSVYGIADQTVLEWGFKIGVGDTIKMRAENGIPLNIIIAGGLQSSVFQGYVIIGKQNFMKYFPAVSGNSVFLVDGENEKNEYYKRALSQNLTGYGPDIENTTNRLASFYEITNTYLSVFGVFGALGMITGIAGLGFVILRNYNRRKREFALMIAIGFAPSSIRRMVFSEQMLILFVGIISGVIPAIIATLPSLSANHDIPWIYLSATVSVIFLTGVIAVLLSVWTINKSNLISAIRRD